MADISITAASVLAGTGAAVREGTFGATITAGKVVALDATTGKMILADNNSATAAVRQADGIALNGGSDGQPGHMQTSGPITVGGTLTPGVAYYLSDTPGGICPVADVGSGEYAVLLGIATSASVLELDIQISPVAL